MLWDAFPLIASREWVDVLAGHSCGEKTLQLSRASGSHYEINLGTMTQLNTETRRERKIRRLTHKPPPPSKPSATVPREYGAQTRGIVASVSWLASSSTAEGERVTSCELQVTEDFSLFSLAASQRRPVANVCPGGSTHGATARYSGAASGSTRPAATAPGALSTASTRRWL